MPNNEKHENEKIVIDLFQTDTKAFEDTNFIQVDARKKLLDLVGKFKDNISNHKEGDRVHRTILIQGKRGAGKTSFILSVKKKIESAHADVCALDIIDPTLIESKEHVFLNIITLIKAKIDSRNECNRCESSNAKYRNWKESLRRLAGGLSMLEGVGKNHLENDLWDSPELILEKGLSNSMHGYRLEANFHKYITESLEVLNKKAFFLILDDIDTSLKEGRIILETIRKYLTSPQLIIVLLGDIELYSTLVRQLQWEKIDPNKTLKEYEFKGAGNDDRQAVYLKQIEHLEEQYLTKVLMTENRIDLQGLLELSIVPVAGMEDEKLLCIKTESSSKTLDSFMNDWVENVFSIKRQSHQYVKYFKNTLLSQSVRSVLQVLQSWQKYKLSKEYLFSYKHTFYTTLMKQLGKYGVLEIQDDSDKLLYLSAIYLADQKKANMDYFSKFIPQSMDSEVNIAILYLNALIDYNLKPPCYLSYIIKTGYIFINFPYADTRLRANYKNVMERENNTSASAVVDNIVSSSQNALTNLRDGDYDQGNHFVKSDDFQKAGDYLKDKFFIRLYDDASKANFYLLSFFKLLGYIADISSAPDKFFVGDKGGEDEKYISDWLVLSCKVDKLPIFVLTAIWQRTANTIKTIDSRPENKGKPLREFFRLYIYGFLNAILIEIEAYQGKTDMKSLNVSTSSQQFIDKVKELGLDIGTLSSKEELSYFEYMYLCPFLNIDHIIFNDKIFDLNRKEKQDIQKTTVQQVAVQKIDFSKLSTDAQKEIIKSIKDWEKYATSTILNELRYTVKPLYRNLSWAHVEALLKEMKR